MSIKYINYDNSIGDDLSSINLNFSNIENSFNNINDYINLYAPILETYLNTNLEKYSKISSAVSNNKFLWEQARTLVTNNSKIWVQPIVLLYPCIIEEPTFILTKKNTDVIIQWLNRNFPVTTINGETNYLEDQEAYVGVTIRDVKEQTTFTDNSIFNQILTLKCIVKNCTWIILDLITGSLNYSSICNLTPTPVLTKTPLPTPFITPTPSSTPPVLEKGGVLCYTNTRVSVDPFGSTVYAGDFPSGTYSIIYSYGAWHQYKGKNSNWSTGRIDITYSGITTRIPDTVYNESIISQGKAENTPTVIYHTGGGMWFQIIDDPYYDNRVHPTGRPTYIICRTGPLPSNILGNENFDTFPIPTQPPAVFSMRLLTLSGDFKTTSNNVSTGTVQAIFSSPVGGEFVITLKDTKNNLITEFSNNNATWTINYLAAGNYIFEVINYNPNDPIRTKILGELYISDAKSVSYLKVNNKIIDLDSTVTSF